MKPFFQNEPKEYYLLILKKKTNRLYSKYLEGATRKNNLCKISKEWRQRATHFAFVQIKTISIILLPLVVRSEIIVLVVVAE